MLRSFRRRIKKILRGPRHDDNKMHVDFAIDGLGVAGKNLSFLAERKFSSAWDKSVALNKEGWHGSVPDIRWRAHVACWAARQALNLEGDFVECGVHTGLLSLTICHYLDFNQTDRRFWLFDTFEGIPTKALEESEVEHVGFLNSNIYFDVYALAKRNFAPFKNATLIRGFLPDTLALASIDRIAYLSIDLNNVAGEKAVIEELWPKVVPGGLIVLDDYAFAGYELQHDMWDQFALGAGRPILTLPTGQGLLVR